MKMPPRKTSKKQNRRLSPAEWIAAEELYRQGWTQAQISDKYGCRIETVSRHMTKRNIKGGESAATVREELAAALAKKQRDFAEAKAQRQIDSKEMLYKMTNILVGTFAKEMRDAQAANHSLAALAGSAKALKDALTSLKLGREEMYVLLDIDDAATKDELPDLSVSSMTLEEEADLRSRVAPDDDDEDDTLADQMSEVVEAVDRAVENTRGR